MQTETSVIPPAAGAPATRVPADAKQPKHRKTVKVLSIAEASTARALPAEFNAANGEPRLARSATVLGANGQSRSVDVVGTSKQWSFFNGETVEASYAESSSTPGSFQWYFSPVAGGERIADESAF